MKTKPWQWLEAFACQSALISEWERELGDEFAMGRAYLRPTQRLAESLPCQCGCRHRVVPRAADLFAAKKLPLAILTDGETRDAAAQLGELFLNLPHASPFLCLL